jgi:Mycobacterial 4 TMS phage holin, superfamily IV/Beta-lactamase superfamily domain
VRRLAGRHAVLRLIVVWVVTAVTLFVLSSLIPEIDIPGWGSAFATAALIGLLNAVVWPLFVRLALPITVLTLGVAGLLLRRGFEQVVEVETGEEVRLGDLVARATPADHEGGRGFLGTELAALGYLIRGSRRIYFAGDTDLFEGMATLSASLDVALVPIWGWGPSLGPGHLDPRRAGSSVRAWRCRYTGEPTRPSASDVCRPHCSPIP